MKTHKILLLAGFIFFTAWVYSQAVETQLQTIINSVYDENPESIGIMVHVESSSKEISWSGAVGYTSQEKDMALSPEQTALIASNIKTYVSATILRLVEDKKLTIEDPIKKLVSKKSEKLFTKAGYDLDLIRVKHLLSHTSGIQNYANQDYVDFIDENKKYRWTRDEQLELTLKSGPPLGEPGAMFNYTDANYLLLTEIIEGKTNKPFYTSMRELLKYDELNMNATWFPTLEEQPEGSKPMAHQYWIAQNWDSYDIDVSMDLYGGGGIASTAEDLARFTYDLFNHKIVTDPAVLDLIYTQIKTNDPEPIKYYMGISSNDYNGSIAYGHSGFWGSKALYFPDLNTSIAVFILVRDYENLQDEIINQFLEVLKD